MKLIEFQTDSPEENIALDELMLMRAELGEEGETLRFWESPVHFVVLGRASKAREDCFLARCRKDGIKVIRRVSGGGTVLQGPGCLNYSAVLSYKRDADYRNIDSSYRKILGGISDLLNKDGHAVSFKPVSDIALKDKKISGNSQARKRSFFLIHGTFLLDLDIDRVSFYLRHPSSEPEYRRKRPHSEFLANIPVQAGGIRRIFGRVFPFSKNVCKLDVENIIVLKKESKMKRLSSLVSVALSLSLVFSAPAYCQCGGGHIEEQVAQEEAAKQDQVVGRDEEKREEARSAEDIGEARVMREEAMGEKISKTATPTSGKALKTK